MPPIIIRDQMYRQLLESIHLNNIAIDHNIPDPHGNDTPQHRSMVNLAIPTRRHPQLDLT